MTFIDSNVVEYHKKCQIMACGIMLRPYLFDMTDLNKMSRPSLLDVTDLNERSIIKIVRAL